MPEFSLRARWVLPVDRPPIDGGYVTVADGRIVDVGAGRPKRGTVEELGDATLLPGLVNAHTHLEFSGLAAPLGSPGISLPAWIRLVIGERRRGDRDAAGDIAAGMRESVAAGVTAIGDIASGGACAGPPAVVFHEAIGFSGARVESALADVVQRLSAGPAGAGVSPHAPYTVHPKLVERLVALADERGAPVAMHLAESREELELLATGGGAFRELLEERSMWDGEAIPRGARPLDYLRQLSLAPRALVVHGNFLGADEIQFLAARRATMSVAFCPRTHAWFGHAAYPLREMLDAGVRVALGTDSRASNPDLSLLAEVRFAAARHPNVSSEAWLRMATLGGAEALGLGAEAGSLSVGKRADMVALVGDGRDAALDPYAAVIEGRTRPARVWLSGARVHDGVTHAGSAGNASPRPGTS